MIDFVVINLPVDRQPRDYVIFISTVWFDRSDMWNSRLSSMFARSARTTPSTDNAAMSPVRCVRHLYSPKRDYKIGTKLT